MINDHFNSAVTLAHGLISVATGVIGVGVAQAAGSPDWISLILGPAGALVVGWFFINRQDKKAEAAEKKADDRTKADSERAARLETKFIEVLDRTATLAGKYDAVMPRIESTLDDVHASLSEFNSLKRRESPDSK